MKSFLVHLRYALLIGIFLWPDNSSARIIPVIHSISEVKNDTVRNEMSILLRSFGKPDNPEMDDDTLKPYRLRKKYRKGDQIICLKGKSGDWTIEFSSQITNFQKEGRLFYFDIRIEPEFIKNFYFYHGQSGWRCDTTIPERVGTVFANEFSSIYTGKIEMAAYLSTDCKRRYLVIQSLNDLGQNKMLILAYYMLTNDLILIQDIRNNKF